MFSKDKITIAYTIEQCTQCDVTRKREFGLGDIIFAEVKCSSCNGKARIEKIFGQTEA